MQLTLEDLIQFSKNTVPIKRMIDSRQIGEIDFENARKEFFLSKGEFFEDKGDNLK